MGETIWGGFRVVINPVVPKDRYVVNSREGVIAFHDRYSLHASLYWARLMPRLNDLSRACWEDWKAIKGEGR